MISTGAPNSKNFISRNNNISMKTNELPDDIREWIESAEVTTQEANEQLQVVLKSLENDTEYLADTLKMQFVAEIYNAMDRKGLNANQLAKQWGKSRQYLSKILTEDSRVNFTIETMVELSALLGVRLEFKFQNMDSASTCESKTEKNTKPRAVTKRSRGTTNRRPQKAGKRYRVLGSDEAYYR